MTEKESQKQENEQENSRKEQGNGRKEQGSSKKKQRNGRKEQGRMLQVVASCQDWCAQAAGHSPSHLS